MKRAGGRAKLLQGQGSRMNRKRELEGVGGKVKVMMCVMWIEVQGPGKVNHIWPNWPV